MKNKLLVIYFLCILETPGDWYDEKCARQSNYIGREDGYFHFEHVHVAWNLLDDGLKARLQG